MKTTIGLGVFTIVSVLLSVDVFSWTVRETKNGGPNGYSYTYIDRGPISTYIKCTDPGVEKCPLEATNRDEKDGLDFASKQMEGGVVNGVHIMPVSGMKVEWSNDGIKTKIAVSGQGEHIPELP